LLDSTVAAPRGGAPSPDYRRFFAGNDDTAFNFRIFTPSIPAVEKYQYYVTGRYKIFGEGLQAYGDILYAKNKQANGLAASPFALGAASVNTSPFNPFRTFGPGSADDQLRSVAYRSVRELGTRNSFFDYDFWRYTVGFNGDFNLKDNDFVSNWGYDVGYVYHRTDQLRVDSGDAQFTPLEASLRGEGPDGSFFNPFVGQNGALQGVAPTYVDGVQTGTLAYDNTAALVAASYLGRSFFYNKSFLYDVKVYGNLFPGLYQGGIGVTVGYEHREQREHSIPDPVQAAGDQLGFNAAPLTKYKQEVDSYFGEIRVPLITSTMNIPFARSLEIAFAYRYEEFDNKDQFFKDEASFDNGGTPRVSVRYQPVDWVTLRGSWGQSFQSPFAFQLFDPAAQNFPVLFDSSQGNTLQPPGGVFQAGGIDLQPEETDSYSAGIVLTPKFLPGFTATVDFYQVYTKSVILSAADFAQILLSLNNFSGNTLFIDPDGPGLGIFPDEDGVIGGTALGVTRDESGALFAIDSQTANAGKRLVNGMDITAAYALPWTNFGQFTISMGYNYFFTWKAEALEGAGTTNFLGDYVNSTLPLAPGAIPYHKGFLRSEWAWKGFDFVSTLNYISSFNDDGAFVPAARPVGGTAAQPTYPFYRRVSDYITLDMQLSYEFRKPEIEAAAADPKSFSKDGKSTISKEVAGAESSSIWQRILWGTTVRVGVNNAFDRNPPTVLGAFNDNYDTSLYTIRNRYWYVGLNKKF
jgi:outer membrane receptor protein involved in Fe transport